MELAENSKIDKWLEAAKEGDVAAVIDFLDSGMDVDAVGRFKQTALIEAVVGGHLAVIQILLDRGASTQVRRRNYRSALTIALVRSRPRWGELWKIPNPDPRPLALLLAAGGKYELDAAVLLNDLSLAQDRLDQGDDVNEGEDSYHGPHLMIACKLGHLAMVKLLLARGANIEGMDDLGGRPLLSAVYYGHGEIARYLLDLGADVNAGDWSGLTPLAEAAVRGHADLVHMLLSKGAKRTLIDAVALDDAELAEELLKKGDDPNEVLGSPHGRLAMYAVRLGNLRIVRMMMEHGAVQLDKIWDDHSLVAEAAGKGYLEFTDLLMQWGADLRAVGKDGKTPLDLAIENGHDATADLLRRAAVTAEYPPPNAVTDEVKREKVRRLALDRCGYCRIPRAL